jgi:hypothetical protein
MINNCCIQSLIQALRAELLVAALPTSGNPAAIGFSRVTREYFASGLMRSMIRQGRNTDREHVPE